MQRLLLPLVLASGLPALAAGQACTGLCLQQVACTGGATTSISGTVYTPKRSDTDPVTTPGDPLPNVLVFIPNAALTPFTPGVSCPTPGAVPDGSPLVGTTTAADGTFHLDNVPVGTNIPLVIQSGRWRRQVTVPTTTACTDTAFSTRFARNQAEGDIPQFAIATGSADQVECVLRKVGIADTEFTNPMDSGRIHLYGDVGNRGGAIIDSNTPLQSTLTGSLDAMKKYDVLMLPCEGGQYLQNSTALGNLVQYANTGGRVYASHFSYVYMFQNPPFDTVVNWAVNQGTLADGTGTINPDFYGASTLTPWLQTVGASTTPGQIPLFTNKHDLDGVRPPTQAWITLNDPVHNNPVMQFTFDTPVGNTTNQCGRVLFNEYHVENRAAGAPSSSNRHFHDECDDAKITPQEQLLEYSLFDLTNSGTAPTLTPNPADFGTAYIGFTAGPQTFTWTNHSIFTASVSTAVTTGDFSVVASNGCTGVLPGKSCTLQVTFKPTAVGQASGTLVVTSNGSKLTANLTGTGVSPVALSTSSINFGNVDVGLPVKQSFTLRNLAPGPIIVLQSVVGEFSNSNACGNLAAGATCTVTITFTPSATGSRTSRISFYQTSIDLAGNGVDFTAAFTPTTGTVIAGLGTQAPVAVLPLAGFSAPVALSCSTTAPGSTCTVSQPSLVPSASAAATVQITTTAQYKVVGYGGVGVWQLAALSSLTGLLLWRRRGMVRGTLYTVLLVGGLFSVSAITGCGSKAPATNAVYTAPGPYTYTLTGTDGFLTHSATYNLTVTAK